MANGDSGDTKMAGGEAQDGALVRTVIAATLAGLFVIGLFLYNKNGGDGFLRDFILSFVAAVGAPFLVWRSIAHDRQSSAELLHAKAAKQQAEVAQQRAENDKLGRLTEVYAKSAEMFASGLLSVRLAGLYGLWDLAREYPQIYHVRIMELLCAATQNPSPLDKWGEKQTKGAPAAYRPDIVSIISLIGWRNAEQIKYEKENGYRLDLRDSDIIGADFRGANLSRALFGRAKLQSALFRGADLRGADLANFEGMFAAFEFADLRGARVLPRLPSDEKKMFQGSFDDAAINGAIFSDASFSPEEIKHAVVLTDGENVLPPGLPKILDSKKLEFEFRFVPIQKWEKMREKWRLENLPHTILETGKK
jgi:hypothetical protein